MHSAFYQVTLPRACALTCGFADVLLMPNCSVEFAFITCFGAQGHETCLNADLLSNSKSLNVQIMLLEMRSGAISFVTTLFRAHQLFDYFLCSLQWLQLHVKLPNAFFVRTIAIQLHLEPTCVRWPLLHSMLVMLNCPLVLGNMADSPSGPWLCSIVSSATSSNADSASAYFSSSNFFELIIRIVLWRHAMCSISHALCCRQGGEDPIWWCSITLDGKRAFISQHLFREDQGYAACST